jgi:hypothetical protein
MAHLLAIVSKAQFESSYATVQPGEVLPLTKYVGSHAALEPLRGRGSLFLVTVRPPDERLWLLAELVDPKHDGEAWVSTPSRLTVRDITELVRVLQFTSGKGITAKPGTLGMSLQTPRQLTIADVQALRAASSATKRRSKRPVGPSGATSASSNGADLRPRKVPPPKAETKAKKAQRPSSKGFTALESFALWRATKAPERIALAKHLADVLGEEWKATGELPGREGLAEVLHLASSTRFVAIPSATFLAGVRKDEVALAHTLEWQEDFTLESLAANAKPVSVAAFLCARAPVSELPMRKKKATAALEKVPFRVMTPFEWELVARDGGTSPFISGRTPEEAEAACAALYGKRFDPKKSAKGSALGVWGLPLGEWVSKAGTKALTGACGGAAQLYPWQGDELVDCLAGLRESVSVNDENTLRFALSLPE